MPWLDATTTPRAGSLLEFGAVLPEVAGVGDAQSVYVASTAQLLGAVQGTAASPITTPNPSFKVQRLMQFTQAQIETIGGVGSDGSEHCSAVLGVNVGTASCEVQPVGVMGAAKTSSTAAGGTPGGNDACGLYGVGRVTGSGTGVGIGAFVLGRRENDTAKITGIEVHSANYGTLDAAYNSTGFGYAQAVWINCSGAADSGTAIAVSNAFGRQFEVGLGFPAQVTGGKTGGVRVATIRDDGNSTRVFDINGSHTDILDTQGATISGKLFRITTPGTYTPTNVTTDRSFDANATSMDELADVLGSLIVDLQTLGLVA